MKCAEVYCKMPREGKWEWGELEEWLIRSRGELSTGQQKFSHLADPSGGWVTAGAPHQIKQQEEPRDGKHREEDHQEDWEVEQSFSTTEQGEKGEEKRRHNVMNAITHLWLRTEWVFLLNALFVIVFRLFYKSRGNMPWSPWESRGYWAKRD